MMRISYLAAAVFAVCATPTMAVEIFDVKTRGMAGVGVAGGLPTAAVLNPALVIDRNKNHDVYFQLGLGAEVSEFQDTIDTVDAAQFNFGEIETSLNNSGGIEAAKHYAREAMANLDTLDADALDVQIPVGLGFYHSGEKLGYAITLNTEVFANGGFDFSSEDRKTLQDIIDNPETSTTFDEDKLTSTGTVRAVALTEVAVSLATSFELNPEWNLAVGIAPKLQRIDTFYYQDYIASYNEDNLTNDENMSESTEFNFDIGVRAAYGENWSFGLVARNLISQEVEGARYASEVAAGKIPTQEILKLEPQYTIGASWANFGLQAEVNLDLAKNKSFVLENLEAEGIEFMTEQQWLRTGIAYNLADTINLRAGYRTNLAGNKSSVMTAGISLTPFDLLHLDLAASSSDDERLGAALQLGFKF